MIERYFKTFRSFLRSGKFLFLLAVSALLIFQSAVSLGQQNGSLPRLIVLTDISSLLQTEGEPDDGQSMVRLMLYTNDFEIEGLIATSNLRHGQRTRPELIRQAIDAYARVHPNLLLHDKDYPSPVDLKNVVKAGQPIAGPKVPFEESVGEGKDTEGSEWIIKVVDEQDARPVWISIWGGSADLAQALWKVKASRTASEVKKFVEKLRVHFVYDQDTTSPWIRETFPDLFVIFRHHGIRGMYRGGDTTLVRSHWVKTNLRNHGALGDLYVEYHGGDVWAGKLGRVNGIKEGDTPSVLYLMNNGLNVPDHPELGNWGGRFRKDGNIWVEAVDSVGNWKTDMDPRMAALYRWRPAWQADFEARLDWCIKSFTDANHPPLASNVLKKHSVRSGRTIKLSASKFNDPDHDELNYKWFFYPEEGSYKGVFPTLNEKGAEASFVAPAVPSTQAVHVIVEVSDNGEPSLTAYERFIVTVRP